MGLVLGMVALVAAAALVHRRTGVPTPVLLVVAGLVYSVLPGTNLTLNPEVILVLVLPPLLYSAALDASLIEIRANLRPIVLLSVFLVLFIALTLGVLGSALVPELGFAAAVALGAAVAPPDAVAALAIGRKVGLPRRALTLIEGEGLINDATALTLFLVAVEAAGGAFSLPGAVGRFVLATAGGVAVGVAVAWVIAQVRRRLEEPLVENVLSLATPFLAFLPAERIHASGVLAVVVCGLVLSHHSHALQGGSARLQTRATWHLLDFLLQGLIFLLIGQQLPTILGGLAEYPISTLLSSAVLVVVAVVVLRPLWIFPTAYLPQRLSARLRERDPYPPWREVAAVSWAGSRGVVSLAAISTLPPDFPQRPLLVFLTFVVVLATLLGQGMTLAPLLRRLGIRPDEQEARQERAEARHAAVAAGLRRLEELAARDGTDEQVVERLADLVRTRQEAVWERIDEQRAESAFARLRRQMIVAERDELQRWRDAGRLDDAGLRDLQRELDLEEDLLVQH